jgi:hypothetical protein
MFVVNLSAAGELWPLQRIVNTDLTWWANVAASLRTPAMSSPFKAASVR